MNAQIIQFPSQGQRAVNARYQAHWAEHQRYIFDHLVRDGYSFDDASKHIEDAARDEEEAKTLPERDQLLFLAQRALSRMKESID